MRSFPHIHKQSHLSPGLLPIYRHLRYTPSALPGWVKTDRRFGILTNGSVWRLYDRRARPRAGGFFEADLDDLLQLGNEDALQVFLLCSVGTPSLFKGQRPRPSWKPPSR